MSILLEPISAQQLGETWIYQYNLASSGLANIQSITIEDDNQISGGLGANSGTDFDWIQISPTFITDPAQARTLTGINAFNFSDAGVVFQPGFLVPARGETQLVGATADGRVDFAVATLDKLDGRGLNRSGRISLGESGKLSFNLNSPIPPSGLYLYISEVGEVDSFRVRVADAVVIPDSNAGVDLVGTDNNDVIDLSQGNGSTAGQKNDLITGGAGNDIISAGAGNDILVGGTGADTLTGGVGADRFVFSGPTKRAALRTSTLRSRNRITDFQFDQGDRFQLDFDNNLSSIELPKRLFNAGRRRGSLRRALESVYEDRNLKRSGDQALRSNQAAFFSARGKTYLTVNDGRRGFSVRNDLVADVTGIQLNAGDLSKLNLAVPNYFV
jgi:Ca2+-binding RTX toxin-like protein